MALNAPQVLSSHVWLTTTCHLQARGGPAGALVPVCLLTKDLTWTNASSLDSARCSVYRKQARELTGRGPTFRSWSKCAFPLLQAAINIRYFQLNPKAVGRLTWETCVAAHRSHHLTEPRVPSTRQHHHRSRQRLVFKPLSVCGSEELEVRKLL